MRIKLLLTVLSLAASLPGVAQTPYQMAGPYDVVARDGEFRNTKAGSERDMRAAFDYAQKGDSANALLINVWTDMMLRFASYNVMIW